MNTFIVNMVFKKVNHTSTGTTITEELSTSKVEANCQGSAFLQAFLKERKEGYGLYLLSIAEVSAEHGPQEPDKKKSPPHKEG